jgi:NAD(P)-dependent dehydrogenase (short-subunit alcohol dehydrogenase family)
MLDERLGKIHFWLLFIGFHTTFLVQHLLGMQGMARRYADYLPEDGFTLGNRISTAGSVILAISMIPFAVNVWKTWRTAPLVDMTDEQWSRVLDISLTGTMRCTRAALRRMIPQCSGAIVNNASVLGWRAQAGQSHYAAAKAGVMALTRCAAVEAASANVRINAVAPSLAMHPFLAKVTSEQLLSELDHWFEELSQEACGFRLPNTLMPPQRISVRYDHRPVPHDPLRDDGWEYDVPEAPSRVIFYGSYCERLRLGSADDTEFSVCVPNAP